MGSKEDQEKAHIGAFVEQAKKQFTELAGLDLATLKHLTNPHDPPDFEILLGTLKIGIEHRRVSSDNPQPQQSSGTRKRESDHDKVVQKARNTYFSTNNLPLAVTVYFRSTEDMKPTQQMGDEIANIVIQWLTHNPSHQSGHLTLDYDHVLRLCVVDKENGTKFNATWPDAVAFISVTRFPPHFKESLWKVSGSGFLTTMNSVDLQPYVDAKDAAIESQRRKRGSAWDYNEVWLVLVAEWTAPSSFVEFAEGCHCTAKEFNRIFAFPRTLQIKEVSVK